MDKTKNIPPTLADAAIKQSFKKPHAVPHALAAKIAKARRFVLDRGASAFLSDSGRFWQSPVKAIGTLVKIEYSMKFALLALCVTFATTNAYALECTVDDPTGTPLNVRSQPNGPIVGALHNGAAVFVSDLILDGSGRRWAKIVPVEEGESGWVFREYLMCTSVQAAEKGIGIGWVKSSDIECEKDNTCSPKDNYTTVHKNGGLCATYGIPVYNRPNGTPIGELSSAMFVVRGEQSHGYTFISSQPEDRAPLMPYDPKNLKECG